MSSRDLVGQVALVLFAMALVSAIELVVPLRPRFRSAARMRVNLVLTALVIGLNWLGSTLVALVVAKAHAQRFGLFAVLNAPRSVRIVAGIVLLDFFTYLAHVAMHRVPIFWRFHRVHHSDPFVDVTTSLRFHPLEGLWRLLCTIVPTLALGVPWQGFVVYRLISVITGLLEHSNVSVPTGADRALSQFWVTPNMHKVHHSSATRHAHANYGNILALYDRLFGTIDTTNRVVEVEYGLETIPAKRVGDLGKVLLLPLERASRAAAGAPGEGGTSA
jgi:sterol desaturase/sphingolipid hydroxylase (fatty acid hydroxylase superfamily)